MLVGIDRVRVVRDLAEAWQAAIARRDMRLVMVEGPTGIGKTAAVQALYEQWATLQLRPAYWPATLHAAEPPGIRRPVPTITGGDAAVSRQGRAARIYPVEVAPAQKTRLEWFWWGLTAEIGGFAALAGAPQIKAHVQGIAEAVARGTSRPGTAPFLA